MAFDYKKEYKEFYLPKDSPVIVRIPKMNYIAIKGEGDPNEVNGEYQKAMAVLYGIAYSIKMSKLTDHKIEGYFDYVVPPLEGLWWQDGIDGIDNNKKELFKWISMIRLPEFVTLEEFEYARSLCSSKKQLDCSKAFFFEYEEGLCVQIMHHGSFDNEPSTIKLFDKYLEDNGYINDISISRRHHEIYLSDFRKTVESKRRTVIRHPIKKID